MSTDTKTLPRFAATFTCQMEHGPLYYFAPAVRAKPPYTHQRHVAAIIDVADDGTLAGVELIDNMPPPPTVAMSTDTKTLSERQHDSMAVRLRSAQFWLRAYPDGELPDGFLDEAADELDAKDALLAEHDGAGRVSPCTCLEVYGEDPACPVHGRGTDWGKANPDIAELAEKAAQSDAKDALLREAADVMRGVLNSRLKSDFDRARTLLSKLTEATKP